MPGMVVLGMMSMAAMQAVRMLMAVPARTAGIAVLVMRRSTWIGVGRMHKAHVVSTRAHQGNPHSDAPSLLERFTSGGPAVSRLPGQSPVACRRQSELPAYPLSPGWQAEVP